MIVWCVLFWPRLVRLKWWAHAAQFIFLGTKWTDIFTWKTKWYMLMCSYYFLGMNNSNEKKKLLFRLHFLFVSSSMFFSLFWWTIKNAWEWLRAWVRGRWRYTIRFGVWLMDLWFQWCGFRTRCVPLNHKPSAHRSTLIDHLNKICSFKQCEYLEAVSNIRTKDERNSYEYKQFEQFADCHTALTPSQSNYNGN